MSLNRSVFKSLSVAIFVAACSAFTFGQQLEASYNVSLNLVVGSNDSANRGELPGELAAVSKQLRSSFSFANYRLASTLMGRISNTGNYSYKSPSNLFGIDSVQSAQTFVEWSLNSFKSGPAAKGGNGFQVQGLHFGARVPVLMNVPGGTEKAAPVYTYESIGLDLTKIGLPENTPTMIGTLNLPGSGGTMFLIMTVRSAD